MTITAHKIYNISRCFVKQQNVVVLLLKLQVFALATGSNLYASKARGHDVSNTCQNITSPCRTLSHVLEQANGNDTIMLETNTEAVPYNTCPNRTIPEQLSFKSWNGTAVINCSGNALTFKGNSTTVEFEGLKFLETFLKVSDISLTITNCSFGSFAKNTEFLFLIQISVVNKPKDLRIIISCTTFLEKNSAGSLKLVNSQTIPIFVEMKGVTISNNYIKTNQAICIRGYVNFNFTDSKISNSSLLRNEISMRSLVYFDGCPIGETNVESLNRNNDISVGNSHDHRKKHGAPNFDGGSNILAFYLKGLNFSYNYAGTVQALFCTSGQIEIIGITVFKNTNSWVSDGALAINSKWLHKNSSTRLDVLVKNSSFVSNVNLDTAPMVSVVSQNTSIFVRNCNFSHNQAAAFYAVTTRSSKVTLSNSTIQSSNASKPDAVFSHCGSQVCVMFREPDNAMWSARNDCFECLETGAAKSRKLWRHGHSKLKKGSSWGTNVNVTTKSRYMNNGFESKRVKPVEKNFRNSDLPKMPRIENEETFGTGLLVEDSNFFNNIGWHYSCAAIEVHSEPYISLNEDPLVKLQVRRCNFIGNLAADGTGAIYVATDGGFNISDSIFRNNAGSQSGAIYIKGSKMVIQNCTLDSNSGGYSVYTQATGSLRLTNYGTALIQDSQIIQRHVTEKMGTMGTYYGSLALSSNAFGKIVLSNSVLDYQWSPSLEKAIVMEIANTKTFRLEKGSSIQCPMGYNIKQQYVRNSEHEQSFECSLCEMGSYSVDRGVYRDNETYAVTCLLCPYGGNCRTGLKVLPNFWGYKIHNNPPSVQFSRCPKGYCCQADSESKSCVPYWACNIGRHGRLCGECKPGFTETLFTPSCRKSEKCKDFWFWPMAVFFVLGFSLYLIIQPDIPAILFRSITWFRSSPSQATEHDDPTRSGLERIVFFYYQAIDILSVQSSNSTLWDDHLTQFTVGIFNFDVRFNREGFACPFPGLTPVSKQLFHTLGVFSVLFGIPFLFILHKVASVCFSLQPPKNGRYLSAFLKSVFLGYTVLARKSLTLLHCVEADGVNCLFINCNTQCYTWWQTLIGTLVLVFFIPFVLVLFFGSKKLYKKRISVAHFFLSCLFPLPFLSYWFLNRRSLSEQLIPDTGGRTSITSLLIGSFRVPDHVSAGAIWWESILIGRMLVLILAGVLIKDPFLSSLTLLLLCIFNLSLHIHVRPFERVVDNRAEITSLFSLVLMAIFNLPFKAYLSEGVVPTGPMSDVMDVFSWCQFVLVGFLPLIAVLLILVALFSQAVRLMCFFSKGIHSVCSCFVSRGIRCPNRQHEELEDPLVG